MSLYHVSGNFKRKIFEKNFGMTKIDRHFLLPNQVICFTLYTGEIARNRLSYFVACKCVIYFRVPYLPIPHQALSQFQIFGFFQACHYARVGVWTPYDQKMRLGKSWIYVPLDRGPGDPRDIPWDQNFWLENFLIWSSNDVILCVLGFCFARIAQNQEKLPIFSSFPFFIGIRQFLLILSNSFKTNPQNT